MPTKTHTVTFVGAETPAEVAVVDDIRLPKGQPVDGLTAKQVKRLKALPGLRFSVNDNNKEDDNNGS